MGDEVCKCHAYSTLHSENSRATRTPADTPTQGASPRELLLEACRRNNTDLLSEVFTSLSKSASEKQSPTERIAHLLNTATDGIGNYGLHLGATYGSCKSKMLFEPFSEEKRHRRTGR